MRLCPPHNLNNPIVCFHSHYLIHSQVPTSWYAQWEGPDDPAVYLRSLVAKALALKVWEEKAQDGSLLREAALDLSELFHPDTFLNSLRQQTARYATGLWLRGINPILLTESSLTLY